MNVSIKLRIYFSFFLLVCLFVFSGLFTISHLQKIKQLSSRVTNVIEPSLKSLEDFNSMVTESKMYSTNWVFLRAYQDDKEALIKLHNTGYPELKSRLTTLANQWRSKHGYDSLQKAFADFESIMIIHKKIMGSLQGFNDYDDPVLKLEAEAILEDEVIPGTAQLSALLDHIVTNKQVLRKNEQAAVESSSKSIRRALIILALAMIGIGTFFALYMARVIIRPIVQIGNIISDLGKGIIRTMDHSNSRDEISTMSRSLNSLAHSLQTKAEFAHQVGVRNFDMQFEPLSDDDTLGWALISMRDNLKMGDERLNEAQRIARLGSWEWDIQNDGKVFWSDELFNLFEVRKSSFVPSYEAYLHFTHPEDRERMNAVIVKCLHDRQPFTWEGRVVSNNGVVKTIFVQGTATVDENGQVIKLSGIAQDITSRKKAELALELKNKELEVKNRELEQFAYVASHDLQEPLRTTSSFVELFQKQYGGKIDDKADKYLTYITQAMERMKVLIKDLLDYSRIGRKKDISQINCNLTLKEVIADLGTVIKETNATIETGQLPVINGYSTEIKQLFQNLLVNAIKFRRKEVAPIVKLNCQKKNDYWQFSITDNGIGIEEKHSDRIFIIFQRLHTRSEFEGSGIGLSHCKKIVELHGGKIWVNSTPGEGSTFNFTLRDAMN